MAVLMSRCHLLESADASVTGSGCDLSKPGVAAFLGQVRGLYERGGFHFQDAETVSSFLTRREDMLQDCAAAALQALLVKLEENMIYEDRAFEDLMGEYTRFLHEAVQAGSITSRDFEVWPLAEGLSRVRDMSRELSKRRPITTAMVMNFCKAKDRFGQVHDLQWLLEPPFGDPTMFAGAEGYDFGLLTDTELYIYLVDKPWCSSPDEDLLMQLRGATRQVHIIPYTGGPEREEQTAYFKYIVDNYDTLPDFTIFVHPDAPEHQGKNFAALSRALRLLRTGSEFAWRSFGYYPLAQQMVVEPRRTWGRKFASSWRQFWRHLFDQPWDTYSAEPPRCHWQAHPRTYLPELVAGGWGRMMRAAAKARCAELDDCVGITCGTPLDPDEMEQHSLNPHSSPGWVPLQSCTLRRGGPEGPVRSPHALEISFVKSCAATPGHSAHEDAVFSLSDGTDYTRVSGYFLAGFANNDSTEYDVPSARSLCSELGDLCGGFTCSDTEEEVTCTVREGRDLMTSPADEVSYRKEPKGAGPGPAAGSMLSVPIDAGASEVFQFYTGSQSIVRSDRIKMAPQRWYASMGANGAFCSEFSGYFEAVWHVMFGEPLSQWPREDDPRLPLFLKWLVATQFSYGDERVI